MVANLKCPSPSYSNIKGFTNIELSYKRHFNYLKTGVFYGDTVSDMSSYLGLGNLCIFIGAQLLYSNKTIWYKEGCTKSGEVLENCINLLNNSQEEFPWFDWSLRATEYYKEKSEEKYMASMSDLQQNLDIVADVIGADRMFIEIMDYP